MPPSVRPIPSFLFHHHHFNHPSITTNTTKHAFSTSSTFLARSHDPTYYDILDVPVTATTADIKKYASSPPPSPSTHKIESNRTNLNKTILHPLPPPPPRPQPLRPKRLLSLRPDLRRLPSPRTRRQTRRLRSRSRDPPPDRLLPLTLPPSRKLQQLLVECSKRRIVRRVSTRQWLE